MNTDELARTLDALMRARIGGDDASHDIHHLRRVLHTALRIAADEGEVATPVLVAAAYLHDLVNIAKDATDRSSASARSAQAAKPILAELGFTPEQTAATCHAIEAHSFSAEIPPRTLEARILQDADRLDALGALGIMRSFYVAARMDAQLFDGDDPFASGRPLNDKKFALDHFALKLLRLERMMQTETGRALAHERTAHMRLFLDNLAAELGTTANW